jgi:hypothetical protein
LAHTHRTVEQMYTKQYVYLQSQQNVQLTLVVVAGPFIKKLLSKFFINGPVTTTNLKTAFEALSKAEGNMHTQRAAALAHRTQQMYTELTKSFGTHTPYS